MLTDAFLTAKGIFFPFAIIIPIWYLTSYLTSPLRGFPGPFFAELTNLWRMLYVYRGNYHKEIHCLHEKYGPVVRISPNVLSLNYPELISTIYDTKGNYLKTGLYDASSTFLNGDVVRNLFSILDDEAHKKQRRPIAKEYSLTSVLSFESHMDEIIGLLCQELEARFVDSGETCDLDRWLEYYTWDVIGNITFSEPFGYLENGYDFDNTIETSKKAMNYFSLVGQLPFLDKLLDKNPLYRMGPPSFGAITNFSVQKLADRRQEAGANRGPEKPDFLGKFIKAGDQFPEVDNTRIVSYLMINMIAGADTTAITFSMSLYSSLKNPGVWKRLRDEIPAQLFTSDPSIFSYEDTKSFPFLRAVVDESRRRYPAVAMPLERHVPEIGLTLPNGKYIPPGCIVGMDPYTIGLNEVWGKDSKEFRPERWLRDDRHESEAEYDKRLQSMRKYDLSFGKGSRLCIGQNLAIVELLKTLATMISLFDMELHDPGDDLTTHNSFFVYPDGFRVSVSRRKE